jgi:hypothetical protein
MLFDWRPEPRSPGLKGPYRFVSGGENPCPLPLAGEINRYH